MAMRNGGDHRGSARNRRASKRWLLSPEAGFGGDGERVMCIHGCGTELTFETVERDRKIPGSQGGTYRRENLQPSCSPCNKERSDKTTWTFSMSVRFEVSHS